MVYKCFWLPLVAISCTNAKLYGFNVIVVYLEILAHICSLQII